MWEVVVVLSPIKGAGAWTLVPLSCASASGAAKICQRGPKRINPAGGGGVPSHGREIFDNLCMKTAFSCTLTAIIRGSLCSGIDQFPTIFFFFFFFPFEFFLEKRFHFLFPFFPFSFPILFFTRRSTGGPGTRVPAPPPPPSPLATPVSYCIQFYHINCFVFLPMVIFKVDGTIMLSGVSVIPIFPLWFKLYAIGLQSFENVISNAININVFETCFFL